MPKSATVTVRMNQRMKDALTRAAKMRAVSVSDLMLEGAQKQIAYEKWFRKKVLEGLKSAELGELFGSDVILKDIEKRAHARAARLRRLA
jgi:predicted transcriptional regulator